MSDSQGRRMSDRVQTELRSALAPILIVIVWYFITGDIDRMEARLSNVQDNTQALAVMASRLQDRDVRTREAYVLAQDNAKAHERVVITLREHERRIDRLEIRVDRDRAFFGAGLSSDKCAAMGLGAPLIQIPLRAGPNRSRCEPKRRQAGLAHVG